MRSSDPVKEREEAFIDMRLYGIVEQGRKTRECGVREEREKSFSAHKYLFAGVNSRKWQISRIRSSRGSIANENIGKAVGASSMRVMMREVDSVDDHDATLIVLT